MRACDSNSLWQLCLHAAQASLLHELICDFIRACLKDGVTLELLHVFRA